MVQNRWNANDGARATGPLDERVYTSRLLGCDPALVLHGGGNTSMKGEGKDLFGNPERLLYIKGSGWDLATLEKGGLPAVRLEPLLRLRKLESLDDVAMMNAIRNQLVDSKSPDPSVETLLHAFLPHRFVDHTHADAVLAVTNQPDGERRIREIYGNRIAVVPYVMPGFQLAKRCAEVFEKNPSVEGLILLKHGIFSFGETAKESYDRMIALVNLAAEHLGKKGAPPPLPARGEPAPSETAPWMQAIRGELAARGFPAVLDRDSSAVALAYVDHPECARFSQRGPLTPDHVIRTKRLPLFIDESAVKTRDFGALKQALDAFANEYGAYFERNRSRSSISLEILDPLPRIFLLPGVGIVTAGTSAKDAAVAKDIYHHTAMVIPQAAALSGYEALSEGDIFDVEYWVLEQAKLALGPKRLPLTGKIAWITGGASGIGRAVAQELLEQGASVHLVDNRKDVLEEARTSLQAKARGGGRVIGHLADVSKRTDVDRSVDETVALSGGIDIAVVNAGIFPESAPLESIAEETWERSLDVNLTGAWHSVRALLPWMKRQGTGGDVIFVASKNVIAPGAKAGAYSVAKAGQTQLARVCALEAGAFGVRVNVVHPHLIFDTGIWSAAVIAERAAAYGMSPEQYRRNNLLRTELSSRDVAKAVFALSAGYFSRTTGAQIPVDGGSERTL